MSYCCKSDLVHAGRGRMFGCGDGGAGGVAGWGLQTVDSSKGLETRDGERRGFGRRALCQDTSLWISLMEFDGIS